MRAKLKDNTSRKTLVFHLFNLNIKKIVNKLMLNILQKTINIKKFSKPLDLKKKTYSKFF